jgi:hypothetical protein
VISIVDGHRVQRFTLVILATWEVEIRKILVNGHPRQKDSESPTQPISGVCL